MIIEYHRPRTIDEAMALLSRPDTMTVPMGGGTVLSRRSRERFAVADLQSLGLDQIQLEENQFKIGATVTLQQLVNYDALHPELKETISREANFNLRQMATVAGTLSSAGGRSPFATAMLALDARLIWKPKDIEVGLGDWLPMRSDWNHGLMITTIAIPRQVEFKYAFVANAPDDVPIVCVAVAKWKSGRTRVALGGYGNAPALAMDGTDASGAVAAAVNVYGSAGDQWASAEYRKAITEVLVKRLI